MRCDNGLVHRPAPGVCPAYVKSDMTYAPSPLPEQDECSSDADCVAQDYGFCVRGMNPYAQTPYPSRCYYACTVDAECDEGFICVCGEDRGVCRPSDCVDDAECGAGRFCAEVAATCAGATGFRCQTEADECAVTSDCTNGLVCGGREGVRKCGFVECPA